MFLSPHVLRCVLFFSESGTKSNNGNLGTVVSENCLVIKAE